MRSEYSSYSRQLTSIFSTIDASLLRIGKSLAPIERDGADWNGQVIQTVAAHLDFEGPPGGTYKLQTTLSLIFRELIYRLQTVQVAVGKGYLERKLKRQFDPNALNGTNSQHEVHLENPILFRSRPPCSSIDKRFPFPWGENRIGMIQPVSGDGMKANGLLTFDVDADSNSLTLTPAHSAAVCNDAQIDPVFQDLLESRMDEYLSGTAFPMRFPLSTPNSALGGPSLLVIGTDVQDNFNIFFADAYQLGPRTLLFSQELPDTWDIAIALGVNSVTSLISRKIAEEGHKLEADYLHIQLRVVNNLLVFDPSRNAILFDLAMDYKQEAGSGAGEYNDFAFGSWPVSLSFDSSAGSLSAVLSVGDIKTYGARREYWHVGVTLDADKIPFVRDSVKSKVDQIQKTLKTGIDLPGIGSSGVQVLTNGLLIYATLQS